MGFNVVGRGLEYALGRLFLLGTTHYVDDYIHIEPQSLAEQAGRTMEAVLDLLGFVYKVQGEGKDLFQPSFVALGVRISLDQVHTGGGIEVSNKPERAAKVEEVLQAAEKEGILRKPVAASLHGTLQFADAQVLGRAGGPGLRALSAVGSAGLSAADAASQM